MQRLRRTGRWALWCLAAVLFQAGVARAQQGCQERFPSDCEQLIPGGVSGMLMDTGGAVFNVQAAPFGAVGDGKVDDTVAITAAKKAAEAVKGTLYFPPGSYKQSSQLTFTDVTIRGAGRGGTIILPTSALAGSPAWIIKNSVSNGAIRTASVRDLTMQCNTAAPPAFPGGAGKHPANLIDGMRIDNSMRLENIQVQTCDKGIVVNSVEGYVSIVGADIHDNFYGVYYLSQNGGSEIRDTQIAGNRFSAIGIPTSQAFGTFRMDRVAMGFGPYCIYQEGITNASFMVTSMLTAVSCEGMGNAMFFTNNYSNGGGNAGLFSGNTIMIPGISSDVVTYRLDPTVLPCTGAQTPVDCCTGANTGCDHDYAMRIGQVNLPNYIRSAPSQGGFTTPNGGIAAIYIHNLVQGFFIETSSSTQPTFTINAGNPGWVHIVGFNGQEYSAGLDSKSAATALSVDNEPRLLKVTGNTAITSFTTTATKIGQMVTIWFTGTPTVGGANLLVAGGATVTVTANSVITFAFDGTNWNEVARSIK